MNPILQISPNEYSESPDYIDSDYPPPPPPPELMHSYNYHLDSLTPFFDNYNSDQIYLHSQSPFEANERQVSCDYILRMKRVNSLV